MLDTRRVKADGTYPVCIYLRGRNVIYIQTGYAVKQSQFVDGYIVNHPYSRNINSQLSKQLDDVQSKYDRLRSTGMLDSMTDAQIKSILMGKMSFGSFAIHYDRFTARKAIVSAKTAQAYEYTRTMLCKYCDFDNLDFSKIDYKFLTDLTTYLTTQGNKPNTIGIHLRNIRAVYNDAIKEGLVSYETYPFKLFKIKSSPTQHRVLDMDRLVGLYTYKAPKGKAHYRYAVDVFFLSFFLIGMNPVDMFNAKLSDIQSGRLLYRRSKTDIPFSIKINEYAMRIIERIKGCNLIVGKAEGYVNVDDFRRKHNKYIQSIEGYSDVTFYYARHTWATIASELDIPDDVIQIALGHGGSSVVTDRYIMRNLKKVDEANEKVMYYFISHLPFEYL